jgi:hypothetical protein
LLQFDAPTGAAADFPQSLASTALDQGPGLVNDVEDTNVGYYDDCRCEEAFVRSPGLDLVGFGTGHAERELASRICGAAFVEGVAQLYDVTTRVGAVHTQPLREVLDRNELVGRHELPQEAELRIAYTIFGFTTLPH